MGARAWAGDGVDRAWWTHFLTFTSNLAMKTSKLRTVQIGD